MLRISNTKRWSVKYAENQDWKTFIPNSIIQEIDAINLPRLGQFKLISHTNWQDWWKNMGFVFKGNKIYWNDDGELIPSSLDAEEVKNYPGYFDEFKFDNSESRQMYDPTYVVSVNIMVRPNGDPDETEGFYVGYLEANVQVMTIDEDLPAQMGQKSKINFLGNVGMPNKSPDWIIKSNIHDASKLQQFPRQIRQLVIKYLSQKKIMNIDEEQKINPLLNPQEPPPEDTGEYGMSGDWWKNNP